MGSVNRDDSTEEISDINVTPFVDVLLVLLVIFMITAPLITFDIPVNLPSGETESASKETESNEIIVTLTSDSKIFVNSKLAKKGTLQEEFSKVKKLFPNPVIFIQADKGVPYGDVAEAMAEIRQSGISNINLVLMNTDNG